MSELTPDEIRNYGSRALRGITSEPEISELVRMALRTHDAEARAEKAEKDLQEMVKKAADKSLEGYRDMGRRLADSEERAERAESENARLREDNEFLRKRRGQLVIERDQAREALAKPSGEQVCMCGLSESEHDDYSEPTHTFTPMDEYYTSDTCELCHGTEEVCMGENPADPDAWDQCPHCDARTPEQMKQAQTPGGTTYYYATMPYPDEPEQAQGEGQERGEYDNE